MTKAYYESPARLDRRGGIRDFAEFSIDNRLALGVTAQFESLGCDFPVDDVRLCYVNVGTQADKTREGIDTLTALVPTFGLYAGIECFLDGGDDFEDRAKAALLGGEDRGLEKRLNTWVQTLSSNAASSLLDAIAKADENADDTYIGGHLILMNRGDAVRAKAQGALDYQNGKLVTANGTPVLASGQVTVSTVTPIGSLAVHHSDVLTSYSPMVTTNRQMAIAERVYSILVDCNYAARFVVS